MNIISNLKQNKTLKFFSVLLAIAILIVRMPDLVGSNPPSVQAQTAQTDPNAPVCEPFPTDPEQILECNYWQITHPTGNAYAPGTDPSNPVEPPLSGLYGISGAYSPSNDRVLIVGGEPPGKIKGVLLDAQNLTSVSGAAFQISQTPSTDFAGNPLAVYDPSKDRFFVIWSDTRGTGTTPYVYGRFLAANGTAQGNDFKIGNMRPGTGVISDLVYDSKNQDFAILTEEGSNHNVIDRVNTAGLMTREIVLPTTDDYAGQANLSVNTHLNQYWASMFGCTGNGPRTEDCRAYLYQFDIATGSQVGQRAQLSTPRIGHNFFANSVIEYSPDDSAALAIWLERGRADGDAIVSASVADDGTVGSPHDLVNSTIDPFLSGFAAGGPIVMHFNPWADTFMISTGVGTGESVLLEADSSGNLLKENDALNVVADAGPGLPKWLAGLIQVAQATALGNFNSTNIVTPNGALALSSQNYTQLVFTSQTSISPQNPALSPTGTVGTPAPVPTDPNALPQLINQIYLWSLGAATLLALLMVIIGGYYIMTSSGNAEQASRGKEMITGAIIGLVLLFASYLILRTINPDLVNFNVGAISNLNPIKK